MDAFDKNISVFTPEEEQRNLRELITLHVKYAKEKCTKYAKVDFRVRHSTAQKISAELVDEFGEGMVAIKIHPDDEDYYPLPKEGNWLMCGVRINMF